MFNREREKQIVLFSTRNLMEFTIHNFDVLFEVFSFKKIFYSHDSIEWKCDCHCHTKRLCWNSITRLKKYTNKVHTMKNIYISHQNFYYDHNNRIGIAWTWLYASTHYIHAHNKKKTAQKKSLNVRFIHVIGWFYVSFSKFFIVSNHSHLIWSTHMTIHANI